MPAACSWPRFHAAPRTPAAGVSTPPYSPAVPKVPFGAGPLVSGLDELRPYAYFRSLARSGSKAALIALARIGRPSAHRGVMREPVLEGGLAEPAAPVADPVEQLGRGDHLEIRAGPAQRHDGPVQ